MKVIELNTGSGTSKILVGEYIGNISKYVPENTIVITDKNVNRIYGRKFRKYPVISIEAGEKSKGFETIYDICNELLKLKADRSTFLLGIGGGVVTDITSFVASIYKRGLRFAYVSTTLLGQVDASIGGKNGINLGDYKNIIGTINQPEFIISDIETLKSLPKKEMKNGMAELIKTAIIADKRLFYFIEENYSSILSYDTKILEKVVLASAKIKTNIVQKDEKENNLRRILNFGHTFGHAIESSTGLSHGKAISIGMIKALKISVDMVNLNNDIINRVIALLKKIKLPVSVKYDRAEIESAIFADKKKIKDKIKFVLLRDIGIPVIADMSFLELRGYI